MTTDKKPKTLGELIDEAIAQKAEELMSDDIQLLKYSPAKVRSDLRDTPKGRELMKLRRSVHAQKAMDDIAAVKKNSEWSGAIGTMLDWLG